MLLFSKSEVRPIWSQKVTSSVRTSGDRGYLLSSIIGYSRLHKVLDDGRRVQRLEFFGRLGSYHGLSGKTVPAVWLAFDSTNPVINNVRGHIFGGPHYARTNENRARIDVSIVPDEQAESALKQMCDTAALLKIDHVPMSIKWKISENMKVRNEGLDFYLEVEGYEISQNILLINKGFSQDADLEEHIFSSAKP